MWQSGSGIRLREEAYDQLCNQAGLLRQDQQAEAFRVSCSYLSRVRSGRRQVNVQFIAGVLLSLKDVTFEDVFEAVPAQDQAVTK
jgi:hypothetical protein